MFIGQLYDLWFSNNLASPRKKKQTNRVVAFSFLHTHKTFFGREKRVNIEAKKASLRHPYGTRAKTKIMEGVVGDLEQQHEELKEEMNQMKRKMDQILEMLQNGANGNSSEEHQANPSHPPGFTPQANPSVQVAFPPYGLPPGYTPPIAANAQEANHHVSATNPSYGPPPGYAPHMANNPESNPHTSTSNPPDQTQTRDLNIGTNGPQILLQPSTYVPYVPTHTSPTDAALPGGPSNHQNTNLTPTVVIRHSQPEHSQSNDKLRLRAIEGIGHYAFDATDLCLVPDVVIPHKFKVPEFDQYRGDTCPRNHLTMYCRKMASCAYDDKLLIHFFQESLMGAALSWYMNLERGRIHTWRDLAEAFLKQYRYNMDMAPDRTQLQNMVKKENEAFKEYAQRWRGMAAQVQPSLSEKEMVTMFIDLLQSPFYDRMIGNVSSNFSDLVVIGERVEMGVRSGKITLTSTGSTNVKKPPTTIDKKKGGETNAVIPAPIIPSYNPIPFVPNYRPPFVYNPQIPSVSQLPYPQPYQPRIAYQPPLPQASLPSVPQASQPRASYPNTTNTSKKRSNQQRTITPIPMTYTSTLR